MSPAVAPVALSALMVSKFSACINLTTVYVHAKLKKTVQQMFQCQFLDYTDQVNVNEWTK